MSKVYYSDDHEWIRVDGDTATVGITDHAQEQLGDIVFVELPESGQTIDKGDSAGVVESVKAASDIYCPLSGEITAVNTALVDDPAVINTSAETNGWLFKVAVKTPGELDELMDGDAYRAMIEAS